jgi:hypothetical protein
MAREHTLKIQLSDDELEQLDELRGGHGPRRVGPVADPQAQR